MTANNPLLLVEDDELVARAVSRVLRTHGFQVTLAADCQTARRGASRFSVGVFDLDLPDGDGLSLALELLARGQVSQAIFFTANADPQVHARALAMGQVVRKSHGVQGLLDALLARPALRRAVGEAYDSELSQTPVPESRTQRR